jgi:hypothetical protein
VPAGIERDRVEALLRQGLCRGIPGVTGLAAAVQEQDRAPVRNVPRIRSDELLLRPSKARG